MSKAIWLGALTLIQTAHAGGRARSGGTLEVTAVVRSTLSDPVLADTPIEAALASLTQRPVCRLGELTRPVANVVRLNIKSQTSAIDVASAVMRLKTGTTPYRALLVGLKTARVVSSATVDFELEQANPEFESALCHPVLSVAPSYFVASEERFLVNADPGLPRAWLDAVVVRVTDARNAERLSGQGRSHIVLGAEKKPTDLLLEGPLLYSTYLLATPRLGGSFAQALEATIDRPGLARFFVRQPARPLSTLIPSVNSHEAKEPAPPPRPAAIVPSVELTLIYDASVDEHKAAAERLQVKLGPLGYRIKLEALSRQKFRERLTQKPDLALVGMLLPPNPVLALSVVGALAHEPIETKPWEGRSEAARAEAANERAQSPIPNLFPLFVQGLSVSASKQVQHFSRDAYGLPRFDDVFLAPE